MRSELLPETRMNEIAYETDELCRLGDTQPIGLTNRGFRPVGTPGHVRSTRRL